MMRAVVVLPTPRTPVSMKAWAMRPVAKAFLSVRDERFLADQAGEILRAVFARQHAIGFALLRRRIETETQRSFAFVHGVDYSKRKLAGCGILGDRSADQPKCEHFCVRARDQK